MVLGGATVSRYRLYPVILHHVQQAKAGPFGFFHAALPCRNQFLVLNQRVLGSSPSAPTIFPLFGIFPQVGKHFS